MEYRVVVDVYENVEFDFVLYQDEVVWDGDLEPDLTAELVARGVLVPVGADVEPEDEPADE